MLQSSLQKVGITNREDVKGALADYDIMELLYEAPLTPNDVLAFIMVQFRMETAGYRITDYCPVSNAVEIQRMIDGARHWRSIDDASAFIVEETEKAMFAAKMET